MTELRMLVAAYKQDLKRRGRSANMSALMRYVEYLETHNRSYAYCTVKDAQNFYTYLSTCETKEGNHYSASYRENIRAGAAGFYDYLKRRKMVYANPFREITSRKPAHTLPRALLNEADMNALLACLRNFMRGKTIRDRIAWYKTHVLAELLYATGCRMNEVTRMKRSDIDLERGTVIIDDSKTRKKRTGILNSYAADVLRQYLNNRSLVLREIWDTFRKDKDLLFGAYDHARKWANTAIKDACAECGAQEITSHGIRHSFGYHLLRSGCDIRYIQELLGHSRLKTTQVYTRVDKSDLRAVIDQHHPLAGRTA